MRRTTISAKVPRPSCRQETFRTMEGRTRKACEPCVRSNTFGKTASRVSNCSQTQLPIDNALQTNSTFEFFKLDRKQSGRQRGTTLNVAIFVHSLGRHELISASTSRKANFLLKLAIRGCGAALCRNLRNTRPTSSNVCKPVPKKSNDQVRGGSRPLFTILELRA